MRTEYLVLEEVADVLRVSTKTVRRWVASGRLGSLKPGRRVLIHREELDRFIRESTEPSDDVDA